MRSPLNRLFMATATASLVFCGLALATEASAEEKKEGSKTFYKARSEKLEELLTETQLTQWKEFQAKQRAAREKKAKEKK